MRILLVDDDPVVTASLKMMLDIHEDLEVVAEGHSGADALALFEKHQPDIGLFDIRMPGDTGLDAAREILSRFPDAKILFLTTFADDSYILEALRIGAKGYLLKQDFAKIVPALQAVHAGQSVLGDEVITKLPSFLQAPQQDLSAYDLNAQEKQIVELIAQGLSNKEISASLFLSEGTIRNYISAILEKLQLRDRTQIAVFYYRGLAPKA